MTAPFTQIREEILDGFVIRSGILAQNQDVERTLPLLGDNLLDRRVGLKVVGGSFF